MSVAPGPIPSEPVPAEPVAAGTGPSFPPLLRGRVVKPGLDPFETAAAAAALGEAPGQIFHGGDRETLRVAATLAPEVALQRALAMLFAAGAALNDALGTLAPPEVGVAHVWPDGVKVNGAWCGALRVATDARDPSATPDWMVVGFALALRLPEGVDPGETPEITALAEEGCSELPPQRLVESWSRHLLSWIHRWEEDGPRPLFDAWLARAEGRGREVAVRHQGALRRGTFLGLSEAGDMTLKTAAGVETLPLLPALDRPRAWPPEAPS
jgi:biotin-(acetyl-CoA carboxylase) ligase